MKKTSELDIKGTVVRVVKINGVDFVCLTDMAKLRSEDPSFTINHWMRNRMTIEYLGLWETLYNPNFKPTEFGRFREESGLNAFVLSPTKWITATKAIGIIAQSGRYGGTERMRGATSRSSSRHGFRSSLNFISSRNSNGSRRRSRNLSAGRQSAN